MSKEDGCAICSVVAGQASARIVYEDDAVVAFLPPAPAVRGHTVVASKTHFRDLSDTPGQTLGRLLQAAKTVTEHYEQRLGTVGMNVLMASGAAAQQSVPHVHLHLIPRTKDDGVDAWPRLPGYGGDLDQLLNKVLRTAEMTARASSSGRRRARPTHGGGRARPAARRRPEP